MFTVIVAHAYPTEENIMNGIFEFDQANALASTGHKVILAVVDLRSIRHWRSWGLEHFIKEGVEVYAINIPLGRVPHKLSTVIGKYAIRILYNKIIKKHGAPDIIHAHFADIGEITYSLKSNNATTAKFVVTAHDGYPIQPQWMQWVERTLYPNFDAVISVSPVVANRLKHSGVKSYLVPNMLNKIFVDYDVQKTIKQNEIFRFVFVGGLTQEKGALNAITAFKKAFWSNRNCDSSNSAIKLCMIGSGVLFGQCKQYVYDCKLADNIEFMGQVSRDKILTVLQESNCFVLPSQGETFGVVYIEAMACGLPVIATRCGGPEFFVTEDNGVLIPVNDEQSLVDAFRYMYHNASMYDPVKIAQETKNNFSPDAVAKKLIELYTHIQKG